MTNRVAIITVILTLLLPAIADAQGQRGERTSARRPGPRTGVPSRWEDGPRERKVVQASHIASAPDVIDEGVYYDDGHMSAGCSSCGGDGCSSCSTGSCGLGDCGSCQTCNAPSRFCICFPSHGWVHAEYLNWTPSGMRLPALVTTSPAGTARTAAGILPDASVLYGGSNDFQDDDRNGFRIRFGWWLAGMPGWGIEGEYVGLEDNVEHYYSGMSSGSPILARPFFNVLSGANDSELIAFPGVVTGDIAVTTTSQFDGAAIRLRKQLFGKSGCGYSQWACQTVPTSSRWDLSLGYRFWELDESLATRETLQSQTSANDSFVIDDHFSTRNQFNGAELGVLWQGRRGWWSLDALMRLGIGNVHQTATIRGNSLITENGTTTPYETGFLAQRSNIGTYDRDEFTIIPELGLTLGYQMTKRIRVTAGYSLIYIGNVIRPGDQVDLDVNPNLLAPELNPFSGALRPQFPFQETDYWVQGLSFGGEFRW